VSFLDLINPFNKTLDVVSEYIEDPDKANELSVKVMAIADDTYRQELATQTVPWVDAVHKMGRQVLSLVSVVVPAILIYFQPEINPALLASIVAPAGIYNWKKGRGK
jgi:hypothetical protein